MDSFATKNGKIRAKWVKEESRLRKMTGYKYAILCACSQCGAALQTIGFAENHPRVSSLPRENAIAADCLCRDCLGLKEIDEP